MNIKGKNVNRILYPILIIVFFWSTALASKPLKVLLLPFSIYSEKDLSFIQNGIEKMLSTRLALEGKIALLIREETQKTIKEIPEHINQQKAISLGARLKADYVLFGSVTVFGNSISTDARLVDVHQKRPIITFSQSGKSHDDIIDHITQLAGQINEWVFGRKTDSYQPSLQKEAADNSSSHPDVLRTPESKVDTDLLFIQRPAVRKSKALWKSRKFKTKIKGMAVGDVDGDGRNEIVFISGNTVFIYRYSNGSFEKVSEIQGSSSSNFLGVDIADINRNRNPEIFVTNYPHNSNRLRSFVLEWDGTKFRKISDKANFYYKVLNVQETGKILLGQRRGVKDIFIAGIFELKWSNGRYEPAGRLNLSKHINVYDFAYGNILNNEQEMIIAFTNNNHLRILHRNGEEEWTSSEKYGGSATYIEYPSEMDPKEMDRFYLPQRIHIVDIDKDGNAEVIVVKNIDASGGLFSRLRFFKSGHVECLTWDNVGLSQKWKTRKISEYISDCAIADLNNDGQDELVCSVVSKSSSVFGKSRSFIVSWDMN